MVKYIPRAFVLLLFLMSGISKVIDYSFYEKDVVNGWSRLDSRLRDTLDIGLPVSSTLIARYVKPIINTIGVFMTLATVCAFFGSKRSANLLIVVTLFFILLIHDPFLFDDPSEREYNLGQMLMNLGGVGGLLLLNN